MRTANRDPNKIRITKQFVDRWSARYDKDYSDSEDCQVEQRLKAWLAQQKEPKFLDREHFKDIAMWKSRRPKRHYEKNDGAFVRQVTEHAFGATDERLQLHILMALDGVRVPVASTILHFAFPERYPIMDVRAAATLRRAGLWHRDDARSFTTKGWLEYVRVMRRHSRSLQVHLRDLDKALWAFDKFGPKPEEGQST
jgi:hypothetical protein